MGILLILAQIALIVLDYAAHVINVSPWVVWLPALLFATIYVLSLMFGGTFYIDKVNPIGARVRPAKRGRR